MMSDYEYHELANHFPLMRGAEFSELVADIRANGLKQPVTLYEGKILDGRNRYRACKEAGVEPVCHTYTGKEPVSFVFSLNIQRRDLDSGTRACIVQEFLPLLEAEAAERKRLLSGTRGTHEQVDKKVYQPRAQQSIDRAAQMAGTNRQYVSDAKKLKSQAPELFAKVKSGEKKIKQAIRELKVAEIARPEKSWPTGKYRVIYADPPWSYGNTQPDYHPEQRDHYPVMPLADICAMPVVDLALDDAVLFLWVTSPILEQSFQVVRAWGFKYKASFVWDKVKHNMGHYNSVRHEFLLVCVRGSCQPDVQKLFDSVQTIERTAHSKKPPEFREIIDTIYPHGPRLELFSREAAEGWEVYGYEV